MAENDDFSPEHLQWLVRSRSDNQAATMDLYAITKSHETAFANSLIFQAVAQELAAIAFSLWRAVFLSDLSGVDEDGMVDLDRFLQTLIAHNTISYQTDYKSREWTFRYYLKNARYRLKEIADTMMPEIVDAASVPRATETEKEEWTSVQLALTSAVEKFKQVVSAGRGAPAP